MVISKFKSLLMLLALLTIPSIFAPFYRGSIWTYKGPQGNDHYVYIFGDKHVAHNANLQQRAQLQKIFEKYKPQDIHAILEDKINKAGEQGDVKNSVLINLTEFCQQQCLGLVTNVEFRITGRNLRHYTKYPTNVTPLSKDELESDLIEVLNQLAAMRQRLMNENKEEFMHFFKDFIEKTCLEIFTKIYSKLKKHQNNEKLTHNDYEQLFEAFDDQRTLLDIEIFSSLYKSKQYKHNFIFLGGDHAQNIEKLLPFLSFTKIKQFGSELNPNHQDLITNYLDLQQCFDEAHSQAHAAGNIHQSPNQSVLSSTSGTSTSNQKSSPKAPPNLSEPQQRPQNPSASSSYKEPSNSSFINSFFFWTGAGLLATAAVYGIYWLYTNG